jgi:hypothetical protein
VLAPVQGSKPKPTGIAPAKLGVDCSVPDVRDEISRKI